MTGGKKNQKKVRKIDMKPDELQILIFDIIVVLFVIGAVIAMNFKKWYFAYLERKYNGYQLISRYINESESYEYAIIDYKKVLRNEQHSIQEFDRTNCLYESSQDRWGNCQYWTRDSETAIELLQKLRQNYINERIKNKINYTKI